MVYFSNFYLRHYFCILDLILVNIASINKRSNEMKRSVLNPYFALDLEAGIIRDEFNRTYTVLEFQKFVDGAECPLDMTMMCQRLMSFNYDISKLRDFYKSN